ncbi:MAG: AMP-binding protein [Opitutae bacterium]|jgi:phenylacetate-CoA ligase|nr:AMP-binding protein [Opitutae bacterium]
MNHSAEEWEADRWKSFQNLLIQVGCTNQFHKTRWNEITNAKKLSGFDEFQERCPFTSKHDLVQDRQLNPPYGSNLTFPISEYSKFNQTSGTQGSPMPWFDTTTDWRWMLKNWNEVLNSVGVQKGSRCLFAFSFGPFLGFWTAFDSAQERGCLCIPTGGQTTEQRLHGIIENDVDFLFCTPTYASRLTNSAVQSGVDLGSHNLKAIIVAGETGGSDEEFRKKITSVWRKGLKIHDHYGMTEAGPVAYETPGCNGGLRIILDSYFPEVIDPESGVHLQDGEQGELVLTTLGRTGCPVFRYRTGDLVKAKRGYDENGLPTFDLIGGILGRADDMVVVRGVNLYPSAVHAVVSIFPEIVEYQVIFDEHDSMLEAKVNIESSADISNKLEQALQESFSLRISVKQVEAGTLPRHEMKARRWIKP